MLAGEHLVVVSPADAFTAEEAAVLQILNDPLHGALGDAHELGDLAQYQIRIAMEEDEDVGMIGEESPPVPGVPGIGDFGLVCGFRGAQARLAGGFLHGFFRGLHAGEIIGNGLRVQFARFR